MRFRFESLKAWQKAMDFAGLVYDLTVRFPADEKYGLVSQVRRSAVSISSNLAEGCSRASRIEYARYVEIAYGSLMECVSQALLSERRSYLSEEGCEDIRFAADELARMLSGLRASLKKTPSD